MVNANFGQATAARDARVMQGAIRFTFYQQTPGKPGLVFTTTHGASEDLLNDGFRRMAVNAPLWAAGLEAAIRPVRMDLDGRRRAGRHSDQRHRRHGAR